MDKLIQKYLKEDINPKRFNKLIKIITSRWNGDIKRKRIAKLGYDKTDIAFMENLYAETVKKFFRRSERNLKIKHPYSIGKYMEGNFGGIGWDIYSGSFTEEEIADFVRSEFKKIYK